MFIIAMRSHALHNENNCGVATMTSIAMRNTLVNREKASEPQSAQSSSTRVGAKLKVTTPSPHNGQAKAAPPIARGIQGVEASLKLVGDGAADPAFIDAAGKPLLVRHEQTCLLQDDLRALD